MFGHDVLGFLRSPIFIRKTLAVTGFQPVQAQAKACGYILSLALGAKFLPDITDLNWKVSFLG